MIDLGIATAYGYALSKGYTGTEEEFAMLMADLASPVERAREYAEEAKNFTLEKIDQWLDDHPEATTTVQDGSLTEAKFADALKLKAVKDYVTPQMFGAVCDGTTDDSTALQNCVNYAASNQIPIRITKNVFVNTNITVPSYVRFEGATHHEYYPFIIAGSNVSVVFDCVGICNIFKDFGIKNYNNEYRIFDGIVLTGNSNYNVDSELDNMSFSTMDRCVVVKGRNCKIANCGFGQARVGVHFDLPSDGTQYRGLQVENSRFHEIGSFAELDWFENSACVWIEENTWSNLTIRNCIADQSGTFFYGYCTNGLIENNFIESYKMPIINFDGVGALSNMASLLVIGNSFNGKWGSVLPDVQVEMPEHLVVIENATRINFVGNLFRHSKYESISLKDSNQIQLCSNIIINAGYGDSSRKAAILCDNATYVTIVDNLSESSQIDLYKMSSGSIIYPKNNANFKVFAIDSANTEFLEEKSWVLLGTCGGNSAITFSLPKEFYVRMNDGRTCFHCYKLDDYISHAISFAEDGKSFYSLSFTKNDGKYVPRLKLHDVADLSNPTGYAYTMYFYALRN